MSAQVSELLAVAFFLVIGWVALWPMRHALGEIAYHGVALPVGLMSAALAGSFSTVVGRPLDLASAVAGGLLLIASLWVIQRIALERAVPAAGRVRAWSFAAAAGSLGVLAGVLALARYTVSNNDSFMSYWPLGVALNRTGAFTVSLVAGRSPLIPSMNAVHVAMGSDWAYVIYPMLGATLLVWLAFTLSRGPATGFHGRSRLLVPAAATAFLALEPSFLFHCFFVHSHMVSALGLLVSLAALWMAAGVGSFDEESPRNHYLVVAGVFSAMLALGRPDGLAYQFVPIVAAIAVLTIGPVRWRSVAAFFAPLLMLVLVPYGAAYARLGLWKASKLDGRTTAVILAVMIVSACGPWVVEWLNRRLPVGVKGERFQGLAVGAAAVLMLGVFVLKWDKVYFVLAHAGINLFAGAGGYSYLWYAIVVILALSVFTGDALRARSWTRSPFLSIVLFLVIAGLVHGTSHPGRIGVGDSLNRVFFHMVPVVVWYAAAIVARILGDRNPEQT